MPFHQRQYLLANEDNKRRCDGIVFKTSLTARDGSFFVNRLTRVHKHTHRRRDVPGVNQVIQYARRSYLTFGPDIKSTIVK